MIEKEKKRSLEDDKDADDGDITFPVSCILWIVLGVAIGSTFGTEVLKDLLDTTYGYRWNYEDKCIIDEGYFAGGFCRAPLNCSCIDVNRIDEITLNDINEKIFEERYAYSNRPVVIRNATLDWQAMGIMSYDWLKREYLRSPDILEEKWDNCFFKCYKTSEFKTLSDVFQMPSERILDNFADPWYVGWSVCQKSVLEKISQLVSLPQFMSQYQAIGNMWIFIGTPGYGAHLHLDHDLDLPTWQAQVSGSKTWHLEPPPECSYSCPGPLEIDVHPGDMIIVNTNFWMHSTTVLDNGISLVVTRQLS